MPNITFTQYVRPNGTPQTVAIDRPDEIAPNVHHGVGAAVDNLINRYFDKLNA